MDNNVVLSVAYALTQNGFATLRFNFRGVGNSGGEHTEGKLEAQDALSALDVLKAWRDVDGGRVGVAGYSFGSRVVLENAKIHSKAKAIAVISPPFAAVESTPLKKSKRPVFLIAGDQDRLVQSESLEPVLDTFSHRPECRLVAGADHFWGGYEDQMAPEVCRFFTEHLK
jgi:alpha/beta superfamily hydrolase